MKKSLLLVGSALALLAFTSACGTDELGCEQSGALDVCGDVGEHLFSVQLAQPGETVQWPPVALADGRILLARGANILAIDRGGQVKPVAALGGAVSVLAGRPDGGLQAMARTAGGGRILAYDKATVSALGDAQPTPLWQRAVNGVPATQPVTGDANARFAFLNDESSDFQTPSSLSQGGVLVLDADSGQILNHYPDASPVAIMHDGSQRHLQNRLACGSFFELVARDGQGKVLWQYQESVDRGIVDFAPGGAGEVYIVTEERRLRRISPTGQTQWVFTPPCESCTVAAAPTVTKEAIYFPVWEGQGWTCTGNNWSAFNGMDPLYALRHDGALLWAYDGFATSKSKFEPAGLLPLSPAGAPVQDESVRHHPSGRPVVAADGTLFAAADGGMVVLDGSGNEIGRLVYDEDAVEHLTDHNSPTKEPTSVLPTAISESPVLSADGVVYVWDGNKVHAFDTARAAANAPWIAPFGGPDNAGSVQN